MTAAGREGGSTFGTVERATGSGLGTVTRVEPSDLKRPGASSTVRAMMSGPRRDYLQLLRSMNEVLRVLTRDGGEEDALRASFAAAAQGFGAENALLLVVEQGDPLQLKAVEVQGSLTPQQVSACERGESVKGISPSVVRRVIETGRSELIRDPRLHPEVARTSSLVGANYSVLCAPVPDAAGKSVRAVLYFQNHGVAQAYEEDDLVWLEGYAEALGGLLGYHLDEHRRRAEIADWGQGKEALEV